MQVVPGWATILNQAPASTEQDCNSGEDNELIPTHDFVSSLGKRSFPGLEAKPGILMTSIPLGNTRRQNPSLPRLARL